MIVKMSKLTITGLLEERSAVIKRLMKLGVVQLGEIPMADEEREQILKFARFDDAAKQVAEDDERLRKIQEAIGFLTSNAPKKRAKGQKREVLYESFVDSEAFDDAWDKVLEINSLQKNLSEKQNELASLVNDKAAISVWEKLKIPVDFKGTEHTEALIGTIPSGVDLDKLLSYLDEMKCVFSNVIDKDENQSYVCFIFHKSVADEVNGLLRESGFSKAGFEKIEGTISENIARIDRLISGVRQDIAEIQKAIEEEYQSLSLIQGLYDHVYNLRERHMAKSSFLKTDKAFIVGGWTPAENAEAVKREMENSFNILVKISQPGEDEEVPVLLKNNSLVYPFEIITEMYSLPTYGGVDPNAAMAPFYWFFFGIMLSDAGYGILLSLACAFMLWLLKTQKGTMFDKMLKMFFLGGISTVIWGAAFGGWFGDLSYTVFGREIAPMWFNPAVEPMKLLIWSFIFGVAHIVTGMAINAYMLIRDGKWLDAIFDIGFWYVVFAGLGMILIGGLLAEAGKYTAIAGAVALILTQGRSEKLFIKKITSGILSLYNITGYFSDILSYSRLLALGLATGVVAQVINQVAVLPGGFNSVLSIIIMTIILVGGHVFNMAINVLGAYVHSSRLQYVEFFGKFYESGGSAFKPLRAKVKYLKIKNT